ncbi:MAG: hypothetical protein JXB10_10995 [Pirellulales bacterium]|nr:hypothetical protein [Pirellulales bacterium]
MTTLQWLPPYPAVVYLGLLAGCAVLLWLARRWATSPLARGTVFLLLRAAVLGLLILLLLNPTEVTEIRSPSRPAEMVFLVDCSQSMALDRPVSRLEQVRRVLQETEPRGPGSPPLRISRFRFGRQMLATANLEELRAEDDATLLLDALERLPSRFGGNRPAGVVVFSDGRTTETSGFREVAAGYRKMKVPLHVFPVSDRSVLGDVVVQELAIPRSAAPGTRLSVRVQLASYGYAGHRAEIRIRSAAAPWARPLVTLPITLAGGPQTHELTIESRLAAGELVLEVSPLPGEALEENNRVPFRIASQVKRLRVIYMEATPGGQYRYIRNALAEDPNIECLVMEVPRQSTAAQRLYRINDPSRGYPQTRAELFSYDVVICSDINRGAFTQDQLNWTAELVYQRGGGFAMVGGHTSFGAGQWDQTVWDKMIPFKMSGDHPGSFGEGYLQTPLRVVVPASAERHPIWRIVDDPVQNRRILARMPQFLGTDLVDRAKPGATVLGVTDRPLPVVKVMPVFACQQYGRGRSFAMTTDSTMQWGELFENNWGEGDNRYFRKFWRNVVKWLGENSLGGCQRLRIETDKVIYRPGQPIEITARAYDEKLEETRRYRLTARLKAPFRDPRGLQRNMPVLLGEASLLPGNRDAAYRGRIPVPPLGALRTAAAGPSPSLRTLSLEVTAWDRNAVAAQGILDVQVLNDSEEFRNPQPDPERLEELARVSGGKVLRAAEDLKGLLSDFRPAPGELAVSRQPAWDRPAVWLAFLLLLAVEWILRRLRGLA